MNTLARPSLACALGLALAGAVARGPVLSAQASVGPPSRITIARPRLLIAEHDAFSGLPILRARLATGLRPSDDLAGWALSYVLTGDEAAGRRALDAMRAGSLPKGNPSRIWKTWIQWSLAFDWLYGHPGFDTALKDRIAGELVDGAARNLALQSLADPSQASYHNHTLRELVLPVFALAAVEGHASVEERARLLREQARRALDNVLETTELVDPDGSYHESMDYQRITWVPLALLAELRRTTTGDDPARRFGVFRNMGTTYLYKVLPDGSMARDDDNEYPPMNAQDREVLAYAIHRFKDPFAAWVQQKSGWIPERGDINVLDFLWRDDAVVPRDPAATTELELPRRKLFRGVGHLVLRSGWGKDATWIQLASGPYFAKHDHLDTNHFVIYHRGHLAIDAGADYTDTESPHYLNHYRRTVAHNTLLVYRKGERFFWGEDKWPAANDGGQRMDSSRFWNTVRSLEDWRRTRDLWDRGRIEAFESVAGAYDFARADGTRAYSPSKLERFVRELAYLPGPNVLFVLDRVRSREAGDRKAWLLHGVGQPAVDGGAGRAVGHGGTAWTDASVVTFEDGDGRLRLHPVLPIERELIVRGGPGWEFWTPGDEFGGDWGSGKNWPLDPPAGGPLPADPYLKKMWQTFWGGDMERLLPSNRQAVVPGGWRIEVSPGKPSRDDVFLNVLEIGDKGQAPLRIERMVGHRLAGAVVAGAAAVLEATEDDPAEAEATVPDVPTAALLLTGLEAGVSYDLQFTSGFAPGSPLWQETVSASDAGVIHVPWNERNGRLRVRRLGGRP